MSVGLGAADGDPVTRVPIRDHSRKLACLLARPFLEVSTVVEVGLTYDVPRPGKSLRLREVAARLGCTLRTVYRLIQEDELPAWRYGRAVRVFERDVERYRRRTRGDG